ncbi:uncharacterized protein LOC118402698 isoform X35 [Oncorhynchus keta]|uniref:uncharacterized protein LOC118402698 isoform X35 n=1 Tax=Oncorhynchus keta TaxID=8018 RepID=UPI00227B2D18|nr:uncharacterized protein LOC118402698 isoform X35 [Oncorhynchus keta]
MGNVSRKTGAQVSWSHQAFAVRCSSQVIWTKVRRAMASVCVAVRVRPLNKREKEMSAKVIIHMKGKTISVDGNNKDIHKGIPGIGLTDRGRHSFSYDFSYDSTDVGSPNFVPQEKVFKDLGCDVLKAAFEGYNACVFAYGQTGSGKSYTMIGNSGDLGLIPRICDGLFCHISEMDQVDGASFRIEVSYLEIDNERVQDLLTTKTDPGSGSGLHLREHPKDGPYVENLSTRLVQNYTDIEELMHAANAKLITANTGLNDVSSRSHSIFTVIITQVRFNAVLPCETVSKIHLVDLAGSERTGARLKEGANINKSLVTLGSVISALADTCVTGEGSSHTGKMKKQLFIPYRDSLLTWLLMNSLGGNSKTIMIATISPADVHYGETLSTLRYANRAKNIVDCGLVDEDGGVKVIRELQEEISRLRGLMENNNQEETVALRNEGIRVVLDSEPPHLISIDDDLLSTGVILYHLKECRTLVGRHEAPSNQDIGSVIQLGRGTMFHFNHPKETVQLGEQRKSALLSSRSMVHLSEPTENLSKKMLFHSGMDVLAAVGLTGDTRQQRSSVVSSPLKTCTVMNTVFSPAPSLYPAQNATEFPHRENTGKEVDWRTGEQNPIRELEWTPEGRQEAPSTSEVQITTKEELWSPEDQIKMAEDPQCVTDGSKPQSPPEQGDNARSAGPEKSSVPGQAKQWTEGVQVYYQRLVEFPGALVQLQSLPVFTLLGCLQSVVPSVFTSQRLVALYWLGVANCSQPRPHPSVVLLFESCLYALTFDPDMSDQTTPLTVFHHLPLLQIKEIQVGFGGQSLRLTASTKESVLTLYTHSQTLTQALTQNLLGVLSPGDQRVAHHPFLKEDLMALSLDWKAQVPDLLLDAGLRLSGHFHKTLADLVYILHGNMDREKPCLGEVRLLLYTTVGVTTTPDPRPDPWAQLFLTETHLGLVQENAVFHPAPRHLPLLSRQAQFQGVSLRCRSDIRCLMVGDWAGSSPAVGGDGAGDEGGAIRLDIILSRNRRTRGERWDRPREQPGRSAAAVRTVGRVAEAAILYADSNSCPSPHQQAEVWKLNFSCSSEAACLINHLSNVSMVTGQGLDRP